MLFYYKVFLSVLGLNIYQHENDSSILTYCRFCIGCVHRDFSGFPGNLFSISPREEKLEKAKLLAEQRATDERTRREVEERNAAEQRSKRREKRQKVLQELLGTEKDFLFDLQLCLTTFLGSDSAVKVRRITCQSYAIYIHESVGPFSSSSDLRSFQA